MTKIGFSFRQPNIIRKGFSDDKCKKFADDILAQKKHFPFDLSVHRSIGLLPGLLIVPECGYGNNRR
jgi:hypothetical protein